MSTADQELPKIKTLEEVREEIQKLLKEYNDQNSNNVSIIQASESTLLKIGSELAYVSSNMTDKEFKDLKKETADRLGNDKSNIDKVIKISRNSGIRKYKEKLPTGWSSLYLLCQIEPKDFDSFMAHSDVNTLTTRTELRSKINKFKETLPDFKEKDTSLTSKIGRFSIKQINSKSIDSKSAAELEPILKEFLLTHGWEVSVPADKDDTKKSSTISQESLVNPEILNIEADLQPDAVNPEMLNIEADANNESEFENSLAQQHG
jgi:hypothetical protein